MKDESDVKTYAEKSKKSKRGKNASRNKRSNRSSTSSSSDRDKNKTKKIESGGIGKDSEHREQYIDNEDEKHPEDPNPEGTEQQNSEEHLEKKNLEEHTPDDHPEEPNSEERTPEEDTLEKNPDEDHPEDYPEEPNPEEQNRDGEENDKIGEDGDEENSEEEKEDDDPEYPIDNSESPSSTPCLSKQIIDRQIEEVVKLFGDTFQFFDSKFPDEKFDANTFIEILEDVNEANIFQEDEMWLLNKVLCHPMEYFEMARQAWKDVLELTMSDGNYWFQKIQLPDDDDYVTEEIDDLPESGLPEFFTDMPEGIEDISEDEIDEEASEEIDKIQTENGLVGPHEIFDELSENGTESIEEFEENKNVELEPSSPSIQRVSNKLKMLGIGGNTLSYSAQWHQKQLFQPIRNIIPNAPMQLPLFFQQVPSTSAAGFQSLNPAVPHMPHVPMTPYRPPIQPYPNLMAHGFQPPVSFGPQKVYRPEDLLRSVEETNNQNATICNFPNTKILHDQGMVQNSMNEDKSTGVRFYLFFSILT
ncbi:unnamed protein product [Caenorhabditis bovis]|nr:unnamed protein product [Caenorhabditis bovis]